MRTKSPSVNSKTASIPCNSMCAIHVSTDLTVPAFNCLGDTDEFTFAENRFQKRDRTFLHCFRQWRGLDFYSAIMRRAVGTVVLYWSNLLSGATIERRMNSCSCLLAG